MAKDVRIYATYWTIAGDIIPAMTTEVSPVDFRARVEAAKKAGFSGLGLVHQDLVALRDRLGFDAMKQILADNGLPLIEVECLMDWFATGERRARADLVRRDLFEAAEIFGCRHVKIIADVVDPRPDAWPLDHLAAEFKALCDEAAAIGIKVALELMPHSGLRTPVEGMALMRAAGAPNGGLLLDVWHMERSHVDFAEIAALPKGAIVWVELDDADPEVRGTMHEDTVHHRRLPGEGSFDIPGFLRAVKATGYDDGYGVEIISAEHRQRPVAEAARRAFETTRHQFDLV